MLITLPELAREAGLEYRTAHTWVVRRILTPSVQIADGSGHPNYFSRADVERARKLANLRRAGVDLEGLERLIKDPGPLYAALEEWIGP